MRRELFMRRHVMALILITFLIVSVTGCGQNKTEETGTTGHKVELAEGGVYPMKSDDTLTVWMELQPTLATMVTNFGDTPVAKKLEKQTGVKIEYIHPAQGQLTEQFNLLLASNQIPDIIKYNWYQVGGQESIDSGYIYELNELIDKWAPNLKEYLNQNENLDKMIRTDEGKYYVFPFLREDESLCVYTGPIMRKDWLDDLGLDVPVTIDDWEKTLRLFKNEKGADFPFSALPDFYKTGLFVGAYGINGKFYVDDNGKVQFGPAQPQYKDFLVLMNKWFNEGLLDKNLASTDIKILDTNILNGRAGATWLGASGGLGRWLGVMEGQDESFDLIGVPYPVLNKGETPEFSSMDWQYTPSGSYAISKQCKNPELAVRFFDFGYGEEGHMVYNFGVAGESYHMLDGYPKLSDLILNNPEGVPAGNMLFQYTMGTYGGPFIQDKRIVEQNQSLQHSQPKEAVETWAQTNQKNHLMPPITFSSDERARESKILNEVNTYVDEMTLSFIMGQEPLDNFDKYIEKLKELNIDELLNIYETSLSRYNNR